MLPWPPIVHSDSENSRHGADKLRVINVQITPAGLRLKNAPMVDRPRRAPSCNSWKLAPRASQHLFHATHLDTLRRFGAQRSPNRVVWIENCSRDKDGTRLADGVAQIQRDR